MKLRADMIGGLVLAAALCGCATNSATIAAAPAVAERSIPQGPAGDYPMILGDPYTVDGVTYTPSDALNVDEVGYAGADGEPGQGATASHRTLPMPSYIEVTALDSGKTALVRVERRGPATSSRLVGLSAGALAQLGLADGAPVRVRRVNPPEDDRAKLRTGQLAPLRMDTPPGLLVVLKRRLPVSGSASLYDPRQAKVSGNVPTPGAIAALDPDSEARPVTPPAKPAPAPAAKPTATAVVIPAAEAAVAPKPAPVTATDGRFFVQLGAFAVRANAENLATKIKGQAVSSGKLTLVRAGPFTSRGQAEQALAKLRSQGYSDARIVSPN